MRRAAPLLAASLLVACDDPAAPAAPRVARWPCPEGWVAGPRGGCGPASLLCDPLRGACPSARAWREPGDPDGPPTPNWRPEAGGGAPMELWAPAAGITACPTGWRLTAGACDPVLRADCPAGTVAVPGGVCAAVASATCDDDAFPDADRVVTVARVRAGADAASADGSVAHPYPTINAALARVGDDGEVLVARGEYREALAVTGRATVLGRCGVTVVGQPGRPVAAVRGASASLVLNRVTLTGGTSGAVASGGAVLVLNGVRVTGVSGIGVDAEGAGTEVTVDGLVVAGVVARRDVSGAYVDGDALVSRGGALLRARRVVAEGNQEAGVYVENATAAVIDSVVRGTDARPDAQFGQGLYVAAGGTLTATRVVVEGNRSAGAQATGARATLQLQDAVVRGTRARLDRTGGYGLHATAGGRVEASGVRLADNQGAGARAADARSTLSLTSSVVQDTQADASGTGHGLLARDGGALTATAVVVERSEGIGAGARAGGTLRLDGVAVRATAPGIIPLLRDGALPDARLLAVSLAAVGASVEVARSLLDGDGIAGVFVVGAPDPARVTITNSAVRTERPEGGGWGLIVGPGASLEASRTLMLNASSSSALAQGVGASITLDDCAVRRSRRTMNEGIYGALQAVQGASLTARHVAVGDSDRSAAVAGGEGSRLTLEDVSLLRSGLAFDDFTPENSPLGAVIAYGGATLEARRVRVDGAVSVGVESIGRGTRVTLDGALVRGGEKAFGVMAWDGATLEAQRTLLDASTSCGALALDDGTSLTFEDSVVQGTLPAADGGGAGAVVAAHGASLTLTRTLVDDNAALGVLVTQGAARATLTDVAVRRTQTLPNGNGGGGVLVGPGATLTATRTLLDRNRALGLSSFGGVVRLDDVTVSATQPVEGLFGAGVFAAGRGTLDAHRLALVDLHGVALAASPSSRAPGFEGAPRVTLSDVFVRGVRSSAVSFDPERPRSNTAAAYGFYSGPGSSLAAERAVIDGGEVGFFVAQGALSLRRALVAGQLASAGAVTRATPAGAVTATEMFYAGNVSDAVRVDDALPLIDALPVPSPPAPRTRRE